MKLRNTILCGDVRAMLRELPSESVNMVVTSPPYWGLRDYGTGSWEGGDGACDHSTSKANDRLMVGSDGNLGRNNTSWTTRDATPTPGACPKCGARRIDSQLGLEATPEEYVTNLVAVFREVRRVLRKDGTLWCNLGDSYAGGGGFSPDAPSGATSKSGLYGATGALIKGRASPTGLKPKDLVGIPWRVAFALQADGWWLRSDIIWSKPNPMPESVTDRPTKAHEYLFLLSKSARYYYDAEAIREPAVYGYQTGRSRWVSGGENGDGHRSGGTGTAVKNPETGRNKRTVWEIDEDEFSQFLRWKAENNGDRRDVWEIATESYPDAHFATYPTELVKPCILAGCPEGGIVLDPFFGSGTTGLVAARAGRDYIGIELNPAYVEMAERRLASVKDRLL